MDGTDDIIKTLEQWRDSINNALSALRGIGPGITPKAPEEQTTTGGGRPRRKFSAATRRKMALAQQRRFAALRGEPVEEASVAPARVAKSTKRAKRKMSAEGLANIRAAVKRRWALAKKTAAANKA